MTANNESHRPAAVPPIVDRDAWQAARDELLVREKAHMRAGDAIAAARRRLPMTEVDASTTVIGPDGPRTLVDLFEGRGSWWCTATCGSRANRSRTSARAAP